MGDSEGWDYFEQQVQVVKENLISLLIKFGIHSTPASFVSLTDLFISNSYELEEKFGLKKTFFENLANLAMVYNYLRSTRTEKDNLKLKQGLDALYYMGLELNFKRSELCRIGEYLEHVPSFDPANSPKSISDVPPDEVQPKDIVYISGDHSRKGVVLSVDGDECTVFVDNNVLTFLKAQLQKINIFEHSTVSLAEVRCILTAYHIKNPGSNFLYSVNSAKVDFIPYQFRPALKIIKSEDPKILIADDVGVGKTIEAGFILKELEARRKVENVLIICPRPLVAERKWEREMKRFGETFTSIDGPTFRGIREELSRGQEWPRRFSHCIIPYSLLRDDTVCGTGNHKERNVGLEDLETIPHFDLLIVDEAHTIRNPETYAYRGVELLCSNADSVVFMSATPLQNSNDDLYTLLNLLRPDIIPNKDVFEKMGEPNRYINAILHVLRTGDSEWKRKIPAELDKALATSWGKQVLEDNPNYLKVRQLLRNDELSRNERVEMITCVEKLHSFSEIINRTRRKDIEEFCVRHTQTISVRFTDIQNELYTNLIQFEMETLRLLHGTSNVRFMMCTLMRQASSCIFGLVPFIEDIVSKRLGQLEESSEYEESSDALNRIDTSILQNLLTNMKEKSHILDETDPKFDRLLELIRTKQVEENNKIIIFSTFRNTLTYLQRKLERVGVRVGRIDGSVSDDERRNLSGCFQLDREDRNAIDVLLFSEVGCEGLDYQFCDMLINYDLPWNPMRIEQRIGRIDRHGQKSETVRICNLITEGTIDATVYYRCLDKIGIFNDSLGDCAEILGEIQDKLLKIILNPDLSPAEREDRIEKIADNEVRRIQEIRKLEEEEQSFYGVDFTGYLDSKAVRSAENIWIAPERISELVQAYLLKLTGRPNAIRGREMVKTLQLSQDIRSELYSELMANKYPESDISYRQWYNYLRSSESRTQISFNGNLLNPDNRLLLINHTHPLTLAAANNEKSEYPLRVGVGISDTEIPEGEYPFLIYGWTYLGPKKKTVLKYVSYDSKIEDNLEKYLLLGSDWNINATNLQSAWEQLEITHRSRWISERQNYLESVSAMEKYRVSQLTYNAERRKSFLSSQLNTLSETRIKRMKQSQINKIELDLRTKINEIERTTSMSDLHVTLLIEGILHNKW